jgi:uncharacterized heparinase superfamily protein
MPVPEPRECRWDRYATFLAPGAQANEARAIEEGRFTFLNREETLGWPAVDWAAPGLPKLWQYNLHYFEWLWALGYSSARAGILDWIARHPLGRGQVGWEPYPTSLRLMNWLGVCFGKFRGRSREDHELQRALWGSVYLQAEWLRRNLETHLLGNHLLENGAALAFAGSCFEEEAWLENGIEILVEQIPEQILPDGMHFERSPMYHARVTYLLGLLAATKSELLKEIVDEPLKRMRQALAQLCHPDGDIALLNDSAFGIYNAPGELLGREAKAETGEWALPDAGYYGWRGEDGTYLVCDAGPIGPDYIPGHAHGDIFSFELSFKGRRLVVDSGVYDYVPGDMRRYCRSTRAHNTVEIDGQDQCEFWDAFRVGRRGRPRDVQWEPHAAGFRLSGWHDGYMRLAGAPKHRRTFVFDRLEGLEVSDVLSSRKPCAVKSRVHLCPSWRIARLGKTDATVECEGDALTIAFTGQGSLSVEDSFYCSEFGKYQENACLCFNTEAMGGPFGYRILFGDQPQCGTGCGR